jgi:sporulation protein YlmC with PRC-barrel domain
MIMEEKKERNLYYLHELPDYKVASGYPDIRGWEVKDADNRVIGKVDNLLVNKKTERVVYLDVEVEESLLKENEEPLATPASKGVHQFINKEGENHLIVPIGLVGLDEKRKVVHSNEINRDTFHTKKRFRKGDMENPENERVVYLLYVPEEELDERNSMNDSMYNRKEFQPGAAAPASR